MVEAYKTKYPDAAKFLSDMEVCVQTPGYYRSISGRVRHFFYAELTDIQEISQYQLSGVLSPLSRQARNFPMQELVAATTGKALLRFIDERNKLGLKARVGLVLYDAMTVFAPLEEAKVASELLKNCLTTWCPWTVKGRTFSFEVDASYGKRLGVKLTKQEKEKYGKYIG